eukprot:scaffold223187_cov14-Tisochrysis_lutea.AAC.1
MASAGVSSFAFGAAYNQASASTTTCRHEQQEPCVPDCRTLDSYITQDASSEVRGSVPVPLPVPVPVPVP